MKKSLWIVAIVAIAAGLLGVLLVGLRDMRRMQSDMAPAPANGSASAGAESGVSSEAVKAIRFVKNPSPVPAFTITDLDGHALSPAGWRGKVVLLNFWATWCAPCRAEIPDLIKLQNKYQGKLQIIGLSDDTESPEKVKRFAKENGMNYPIAMASPELEAKFGGVMGLPTSFVVDAEGRVVQKHIGLRNPALYDLEIRALLQMPVEAKVETFEDNGQVLLSNAKKATELPGVDLTRLSGEQKKAALRQLNEQNCTCSCGLTLAQCRINDTECSVSQKLANEVVEKIRRGST